MAVSARRLVGAPARQPERAVPARCGARRQGRQLCIDALALCIYENGAALQVEEPARAVTPDGGVWPVPPPCRAEPSSVGDDAAARAHVAARCAAWPSEETTLLLALGLRLTAVAVKESSAETSPDRKPVRKILSILAVFLTPRLLAIITCSAR
ncbi:hypothetical protein VDGE_30247 [Verticillium dahliae]|uniref:Uncharacterized protein n=1 Tax=Verticillium dahliae TaxID=27337 RepID=A0A444RP52_VERDA|nr:hypothetical protein VDGE_30247 [Verticillium dahliae]